MTLFDAARDFEDATLFIGDDHRALSYIIDEIYEGAAGTAELCQDGDRALIYSFLTVDLPGYMSIMQIILRDLSRTEEKCAAVCQKVADADKEKKTASQEAAGTPCKAP